MVWQIIQSGNDFHLINLSETPRKIACTFQRLTFRQVLEAFASLNSFSSQWVGCMLRKFLKEFPPPCSKFREPKKGYRVYKPLPVVDAEIIQHLREKWGFVVERKIEPEVP
jgi:hypothetical protein